MTRCILRSNGFPERVRVRGGVFTVQAAVGPDQSHPFILVLAKGDGGSLQSVPPASLRLFAKKERKR